MAKRLKGKIEHSVEEICSMLGVGRSTLYRYLQQPAEAGDGTVEGGGAAR